MKTYKIFVRVFFASCFLHSLASNLQLNAQVTIGTNDPAVGGALLQLKTDASINSNSKLGMILPRVDLTSKKNLYPMFEDDGGGNYKIGSTSYTKADEDIKHTGLWVYNLNTCLNQIGSSEGAYVWNSEEWQSLMTRVLPDEVKEFVDSRDGEVYTYRKFGDAGIWMLENLRAVRLPGASNNIPFYDGNQDGETPTIGYPAGYTSVPQNWKNPQFYNENPKLGILYNWYAATNTTEATSIGNIEQKQEFPFGSGIGSDEVENKGTSFDPSNSSLKFIQGICPDGWHLPSDREWNLLEKQIYENAEKYSTYTRGEVVQWNTTSWKPLWEYQGGGQAGAPFSWRGTDPSNGTGHGYAMMAPCGYFESEPGKNNTWGKSKTYWQGGFCALLSGIIDTDNLYFGAGAIFWTSSSALKRLSETNPRSGAWYRLLYNVSPSTDSYAGQKVLRIDGIRVSLRSVRCKKNNDVM